MAKLKDNLGVATTAAILLIGMIATAGQLMSQVKTQDRRIEVIEERQDDDHDMLTKTSQDVSWIRRYMEGGVR